VSIVKYLGNAWLPARAIVERSLRNRHQTHASGRIVLLEDQCPWKVRQSTVDGFGDRPRGWLMRPRHHLYWTETVLQDHLFTLEQELGLGEQQTILYMLYNGGDSWRVQAVPAGMNTFANRKSLPEKWRGLRDAELSAVVGHEGCVFVRMLHRRIVPRRYRAAMLMHPLNLPAFGCWCQTPRASSAVPRPTRARWRWPSRRWTCNLYSFPPNLRCGIDTQSPVYAPSRGFAPRTAR